MSSNPASDAQPSSRGQLRLRFGSMPPPPPQRKREPIFEHIYPAKRVPPAFFYPDKEITLGMIERDGQFKSPSRELRLGFDLLSQSYEKDAQKNGRHRVRDDGSDYLQHAMSVAYRIAIVGKGRREDEEQAAAGLLHDLPEDFDFPLDDIRTLFGGESGRNIADMVFWLTKPKWDGIDWVYPDNPKYYKMTDEYETKMYDSRAENYYDRLYVASGSPSAWVLKAADNLANLYTLANVEPEKRQRNARTIVKHTFKVLSRMLARADIEELVRYMEEGLHFEVSRDRDTIAPYADSWVVSCEPRAILLRQGLRGVTAPRDRQINVYGLHPGYLLPLDFFEVGLPGNGHDFLSLLQKEFPEYKVNPQASYLPPRLAGNESMFRFSGFRSSESLGSYHFIYDAESHRVRVWRDKLPHMTTELDSLPSMRFDEPLLRELYGNLGSMCADILRRLDEFQKKHMQPEGNAE